MPTVRLGAHTVKLTSQDNIYFPDSGITKGDLVSYYQRVSEKILPHLKDRPLTLSRYPRGIEEKGFIQQRASTYFPDWITRVTVEKEDGTITHPVCNDEASLIYLANQGTITLHRWLSRSDRLRYPDRMVFDLDPSGSAFDQVQKAAQITRGFLLELGMDSFVMTTGSSGVHVIVPLDRSVDFDEVHTFAVDVANTLATRHPEMLTVEQRKDDRQGRVFVDYLRNTYGHTAVVPYSVRALPGATVATPIDWDELVQARMHPRRFTINNIFRRLGRKDDPWFEMDRKSYSLKNHHETLDALRSKESQRESAQWQKNRTL